MIWKETMPTIQNCNHGSNKYTIGSHGQSIVNMLCVLFDSEASRNRGKSAYSMSCKTGSLHGLSKDFQNFMVSAKNYFKEKNEVPCPAQPSYFQGLHLANSFRMSFKLNKISIIRPSSRCVLDKSDKCNAFTKTMRTAAHPN